MNTPVARRRTFYWLAPIALSALQALYISRSVGQLRFEEVAESIRNPFWLSEHTLYDGISSAVGWYGVLLLTYSTFGFHVHAAKILRLVLSIVATFVVAAVLRRPLGDMRATLVTAAIALSPTFLYFSAIQTGIGMEFHYGILVVAALVVASRARALPAYCASFLAGFLTTLALLTYAGALFYAPLVIAAMVWAGRERCYAFNEKIHHLAVPVACWTLGAVAPLAAALSWLKDPGLLFWDPKVERGLLMGGSEGRNTLEQALQALRVNAHDLLVGGSSYHFELVAPELGPLATISMLVLTGLGFWVARNHRRHFALLAAMLFVCVAAFVAPAFAAGPPGLRRCTAAVASLYCIAALASYLAREGPKRATTLVTLAWAGLVAHHAMAYATNYRHASDRSRWADTGFFAVASTPDASLALWLERTTGQGGMLACHAKDEPLPGGPCQYAGIFAALAGYRRWNGLAEEPVYAYDWKTNNPVELNISFWESHYFFH